MTTTIRNLWAAELTKLTTTRSARRLLMSAVVLAALPVSGVVASGGVAQGALATDTGLRTVLEHGGLASILPLILGVLISTGEYRHGTVVDTFLTEPRRIRVIVAKMLTGAVVGVVAGVAVALSTAVTVSAWYAAKDVALDLGASPALGSLIGIGLWTALYTLIGVAVGALVRGQAVAIVSAVVWIFVAETAFAGLIVSLGKWLPATAARALGNAPETGLLTQAGGGLVLLGWAAVFAVGATVVTARRDVA
jgi:ABC-2 type transport system permease protein